MRMSTAKGATDGRGSRHLDELIMNVSGEHVNLSWMYSTSLVASEINSNGSDNARSCEKELSCICMPLTSHPTDKWQQHRLEAEC